MHPQPSTQLFPFAFALLAASSAAQVTERVSVSSSNAQANDASEYPAVSADGDVVAFHSAAFNLVGSDSNSRVDVFVRVRSTSTTARVSVGAGGLQGDGASSRPSISDDGQRVAFQSDSLNFFVVDGNGAFDVFVRDRGASTTTCASLNSLAQLGNAASTFPSISPDGRWVAFQSDATNLDLIDADTNGASDVFLHDMLLATTIRVSVRSPGGSGIEGNGASTLPVVAANGAFIAFASSATNLLAAADVNGVDDVFVWDSTGAIRRISDVPGGGGQANGKCSAPSISSDGRYIAFESLASNLGFIGADGNATWDIYVYDDATGEILLASCDHWQFSAGGSDSRAPSISDDGRYVSFASNADDLVWCDTNAVRDVFRRDLGNHFTLRLSVGALAIDGNAASDLVVPTAISADGHVTAFSSHAINLVASDNNGFGDVFVREPNESAGGTSYCTSGTTTNGCVPTMALTGAPSASQRAGCELTARNLEGRKSGIIFYGIVGQVAAPWGAGGTSFLCIKSPLQKTGVMFSGGTDGACDGMLSVDWRDFMTCKPLALGTPLSVGQLVYAQGWFKDPMAVKTTNLTDGLMFTVVP